MPEMQRRKSLIARIKTLQPEAIAIRDALQTAPLKAEATTIIEKLREADAWLRNEPPPEVVTHSAKTVEDAAHRLYSVLRELD